MRVLLTGFGPFPGVEDNPTARVVEHVAAKGDPSLSTRVLPVSFGRAAAMISGILQDRKSFDFALHLGVAAQDTHYRLERFGRNRHDSLTPDVDGVVQGEGPIVGSAPTVYETRAPLIEVFDRLQAEGIPTRISEDPGSYVCNCVYFTALHVISVADLPTQCLFVHVPPISGASPIEQHIAVVGTVLEELYAGAIRKAK